MRIEPIAATNVAPVHAKLIHSSRPQAAGAVLEPALLTAGPQPIVGAPSPLPVDAPEAPSPVGELPSLDPAAVDGGDNPAKTRGVIRLLEEGHFRGVADVRLRINFFEELSARAADRAAATIEGEAVALRNTLTSKIEELIAPLATDAAQQQLDAAVAQFEQAVTAAAQPTTTSLDPDALAAALRDSFDALVGSLRDALAAPVEEAPPALADGSTDRTGGKTDDVTAITPVTDGVTPIAPGAEPLPPAEPAPDDGSAAPTLEEAIESLTTAFQQALDEFLQSLESASALPDPSPPNGNGRAYEKFLAMYNDLRGVSPVIDAEA